MTDEGGADRTPEARPTGPGRFDATIHPRRGPKDMATLDGLDLDRVPDRYGRFRALVTAEDCARILELGYEVRLRRHHPTGPLDPKLIATDESVKRWIEERLASIRPEAFQDMPERPRKR